MSFTQMFLSSFSKALPKITSLANNIQTKHNLITNYSLVLKPTSSNRLSIFSESHIGRGSDLLLLSASECLFSTGLSGSYLSEEKQIHERIKQLSTQYESMNIDFMSRVKIYLQLLANTQDLKFGQMPMKSYSQYVLNSPTVGLIKNQINSKFLLELYQSWQINTRVTFNYLKKQLLKRTDQSDFLNACNKGKIVIRDTGNKPFKYAAPFIDKIDHSFNPNCEFDILYFPHRRAPFIRIKSISNINAGERPTINYGKLNNYELLLRYGFCIKDNPYRIFMLPLKFEEILQVFNKNVDWKHSMFLKLSLKLRNYVKIQPNGELAQQDLLMMRLLINQNSKPSERDIDSPQYDHLIYKFIVQHAKRMKKNIKINNMKISNDINVRLLQDEQISILQNFIRVHQI